MAYGKAGDWYINNVEGGGGSSDVSTVEVTYSSSYNKGREAVLLPFEENNPQFRTVMCIDENDGFSPTPDGRFSVLPTPKTKVYYVMANRYFIVSGASSSNYTVSGNAEVAEITIEEEPMTVVKVYGTCTIVIN